ncbi:MAG: dephospho-CoA kinase [Coriobacteriales bacterium]|nr:dephospho-CoA kinase [Actinomycetes bacterium]
MYVLAITGGIGSGKSTAAAFLAARGAVVLDLDAIAHGLLRADSPVFAHIVSAFGSDVVGGSGDIDHAALARAAFRSREEAEKLDAIMHPAIYAATAGALDALALQATPPRLVVLEVPLLVEAPEFLDLVDAVLAISAAEDTREERLVARGMPLDEVDRRMSCQAGDAERREIADYVIENDGDELSLRAALADFFDKELAPRVS